MKVRAVANLSNELVVLMKESPRARVDLLVRVSDQASAHVAEIQASGWTVRRVFSLTPTLAIQGPVSAAGALAQEPWVVAIEVDKPVHTM